MVAINFNFAPVVDVVEFQATADVPFSGIVALVDDTANVPRATGVSADILWGDGVSSGVVSGSNGAFTISGSHTYALAGNYTVEVVVTTFDGRTGFGSNSEDVGAAPCYCPGTLIRTTCGDKQVEKLAIGDVLMTASGAARPIKWIGRRSFGGRFIMGRKDILPICIRAGALADNVPERDLWISPHHAMYFDDEARGGMLIEAKDLVNGVSIVQAERVDTVEYFHVELDSHDVIVAEGALSESFIDDDSRGMFHNAHEYAALYPDALAGPAGYCASRLDEGYAVEAVRAHIALRAGLLRAANEPRIGGLRGYIDRVSETCIAGWAQNTDHPEAPVCLDIYADGRLIGEVLANRYRDDLKRAGLGSGRHAFEFIPPAGITVGTIEVRRSLDAAALLKAKRARFSVAA